MTVDELQVLITANTKQLRKEINNTNKTIETLKKSADKTQTGVMSAFNKLKSGIIALGIGKVIKDSILSGMNAIESDSLFETSLGNMADSVRAWSDEIGNALGLDSVAMRKNTGVLYNMTTSMGLAEENALKLSKGITLLTEDMASFYNLSSDEAFNKLRAGLTGETEPLKALGILVDENTIKQVAYQQGIARTGAELTQQQKVLARYVAILMQTGNAQGDLARTINSPANQLRILKNQVVQLGRAFGNVLMPVISAVIPYLTAFAKVVTYALNGLAKFLGISSGGSGLSGMASDVGSMSSGLGGVSKNLGDVGDNIGKAGKGLGGVNKGLKDANKNAKKLKGQLAGFDEMTVLTEKDTSSGTSGSGADSGSGIGGNLSDSTMGAIGGVGADGLFHLGDYDAQLDGVASKVDEIVEKMKTSFSNFTSTIDFSKLKTSLEDLKDALEPFGENVASGLKWLWDEVLVPLAGWTIENVVPFFLDTLTASLTLINNVLDDVKPILSWLWENFLQPIAEWTGGVIGTVLEAVGNAFKTIADNEIAVSLLEGLAIAIGLVTLAIELYTGSTLIMNTIMGIATTIAGAFGTIMAFITSPITLVTVGIGLLVAGIILLIKNWDTVKEVAKKVWDKIKEIWGKVAEWFTNKVITPVKNFFSGLWTKLKDGAKTAWTNVKNIWNVVSTWFKDKLITPVKTYFSGMWDKLKSGAKSAWEGIKSVFSKVSDWFKNTFSKAWSKVKAVFSTGGKIFDGIKDGIANVFKTVVNAIIGGINKVIAVPFKTINGLLNKIRNVSVAGIKPFEKLIKQDALSVPQIPKLARGGIIDSPTVAMIGEAGKEAVMPLERNTGWIDQLADKLGDKIGGGDTPIKLTVKLGEDTIFDKFIEYTKSKSFETNGEVFSL